MAIPLESGEGDMRFDRAGRGSRSYVAHRRAYVAHTSRLVGGMCRGPEAFAYCSYLQRDF